MGAGFDREMLMVDVAHDVCVGLKHDFAAAEGAFNTTVHEYPVGLYATGYGRLVRNDE
jgi:hypothetical protein